MNTPKILASALVATVALVYARAAELPLADLPANSALVVDVDQKTFLASEAGKILNDESEKLKDSVPDGPLAQLKALDIDPKSLDRLVVAAGFNDSDSGIFYLYGKVDQTTIDKIAEAAEKNSGEPAVKTLVGERTVTSAKPAAGEGEEAKTVHVCVAKDGLLVASDSLDNLKLALDVVDAKAPALAAGSTVARLAGPVSQFAWLGVYLDTSSPAFQKTPLAQNPQVQQIGALRLVLSGEMRNVTIKLDGKFDSAENAAQIQQMLMGFKAMAAMNPDAAADPLATQFLGNLKVSSNGTWVMAETHVPVDLLVQKMQEAVQQGAGMMIE